MSDTPELNGATWLNLNRPLLGYDLLAPAWKQYVDALEEQFLDARAALSEPEEPSMNEAALLWLNSWAGRWSQPVFIVGETPKRYRIRAEQEVHLAGRRRSLKPGETTLVPKNAVTRTLPRAEPEEQQA